jgi:hypothetical protein
MSDELLGHAFRAKDGNSEYCHGMGLPKHMRVLHYVSDALNRHQLSELTLQIKNKTY